MVAVGRDNRARTWKLLLPSDDHAKASEALWGILEREDPIPVG